MDYHELRLELFPQGETPVWGMVLGTGYGSWLDHLETGPRVPFAKVDGVAASTTVGHPGYFTSANVTGVPVIITAGRLHLYEGLNVGDVVAPVRALAGTGITSCIVTCAVGGVSDRAVVGQLIAIEDQLNLTGLDPATGKGVFPDGSALYDSQHLDQLQNAGFDIGVLAGVRGPSFETPAEARALKALGADVVCMSTVLEVMELVRLGVRVAGVAAVANRAGAPDTDHNRVLAEVSAAVDSSWEPLSVLFR